MSDEEQDEQTLVLPGGGPPQQHTQNDLLGVTGGGGTGSELSKLLEGSDEFIEWAVRGYRSARERVAENYIISEAKALNNPNFPVRARMMKSVRRQDAWRSLFTVASRPMSKMEFAIIAAVIGGTFVLWFLVLALVVE